MGKKQEAFGIVGEFFGLFQSFLNLDMGKKLINPTRVLFFSQFQSFLNLDMGKKPQNMTFFFLNSIVSILLEFGYGEKVLFEVEDERKSQEFQSFLNLDMGKKPS